MIVALDGSGDFYTIQEAIDFISKHKIKNKTIHIKKGRYYEKISLTTNDLHFIGEDPLTTLIEYDDYALKLLPNNERYKTFRSYTIFIGANNVTFENLSFINSAGSGDDVGQAIAAYVDGDQIAFFNCRFIAHQDTLFTGPLPPFPKIPNSFTGPKEHDERINGRQYYENCYIEGDIDFIFGSATCFFQTCQIQSNDCYKKVNGYITAASTPKMQRYGYVFNECQLQSLAQPNSVYLGRPWREFAHVAFINCEMGAHIKTEGWDDWNDYQTHHTTTFIEINNVGPGSLLKKRITWLKQPLLDYSLDAVLNGWHPKQTKKNAIHKFHLMKFQTFSQNPLKEIHHLNLITFSKTHKIKTYALIFSIQRFLPRKESLCTKKNMTYY